jgi:hypothetical protein
MNLDWPAVVLVLGGVFLLLFRKPIGQLLDRTEKVKDWLVAPKQGVASVLPAPDPIEDQRRVEQLTKSFNNQLLLAQEESIAEDLEKARLTIHSATEKVLLRHLAATQIVLHFERLSGTIFRSQVQALRWLNGLNTPANAQALRRFYNVAGPELAILSPATTFEDWMMFLANQSLLTGPGESEPQAAVSDTSEYQITILGREYLKYLVETGRPDPAIG